MRKEESFARMEDQSSFEVWLIIITKAVSIIAKTKTSIINPFFINI
jgi:hypothetical protein